MNQSLVLSILMLATDMAAKVIKVGVALQLL